MENIIEQILSQFRSLSNEDKDQLLHKLRDEVERKDWIALLESLVSPELSDEDIISEVESARTDRYAKSSRVADYI